MPKILGDLLDTFVISTSECLERANASGVTEIVGALGNQSFFCMVRSGLEFVRLWRQHCEEERYPALTRKMNEFEHYSSQISQKLPDPIALLRAKGSPLQSQNATVVLYFDHLEHGTPEGHVESQARVNTCLKLLRHQLETSRGNKKVYSASHVFILTF